MICIPYNVLLEMIKLMHSIYSPGHVLLSASWFGKRSCPQRKPCGRWLWIPIATCFPIQQKHWWILLQIFLFWEFHGIPCYMLSVLNVFQQNVTMPHPCCMCLPASFPFKALYFGNAIISSVVSAFWLLSERCQHHSHVGLRLIYAFILVEEYTQGRSYGSYGNTVFYFCRNCQCVL